MALNASYYAGASYYPADMMQREADWVVPGVVSSSDLVVTQAATPNMTVLVSGASQGAPGGNAWLPKGYRVYNDSNAPLTITTADATNPRIDLIIAAVDTSTTPNYTPGLVVITGTPAASPVVPSVPGKYVYIALAQVYVAKSVTSIINSNITDVRAIAVIDGVGDHNKLLTSSKIIVDGINEHLKDYQRTPGYAVSTGSANVYAVTLSPTPTSYGDGMGVVVKIAIANTGASTLNVNSLGAKTIKNPDGSDLASGDLVAGSIYNFRYNSTTSNFILQGKGGISSTDKQALIDIANEAEANVTALKTEIANAIGTPALSTDSIPVLSGYVLNNRLLTDNLPNAVQTPTYSGDGSISQVVQSIGGVTVRTDTFTYLTNQISELRTLSTGEHITVNNYFNADGSYNRTEVV
ncbi:MAG: hypothetical protein Q8910_00935 [Bacteroidota bacterium]|nr:hypothetical protein [Bacteroidota bacterium]